MASSLRSPDIPPESISPVGNSVRQLRSVARCLATNRQSGDLLCEETLLAFLAVDPPIEEDFDCFPDLVRTLLRVYRAGEYLTNVRPDPDPALELLSRMPVEGREAAALYLGAGLTPEQTADMLGRDRTRVLLQLSELLAQLRLAYTGKDANTVVDNRPLNEASTQVRGLRSISPPN